MVGIVAVASGWGSVIESGKVVRAEALLGLQAALLVEDQSDSEIFLQVCCDTVVFFSRQFFLKIAVFFCCAALRVRYLLSFACYPRP